MPLPTSIIFSGKRDSATPHHLDHLLRPIYRTILRPILTPGVNFPVEAKISLLFDGECARIEAVGLDEETCHRLQLVGTCVCALTGRPKISELPQRGVLATPLRLNKSQPVKIPEWSSPLDVQQFYGGCSMYHLIFEYDQGGSAMRSSDSQSPNQ